MAVVIKLAFPSGRYHATPWGRHVNEGIPEWPPSPWRLLRAIIAVWKRTCPELSEQRVRRVLEPLLSAPRFNLPPFRVAHTRHYMPLGNKSPKEIAGGGTTLVFDTFVSVNRQANVCVGWPDAELNSDDCVVLDKLIGNLSSFGRAEGWVHAELFDGMVDLPLGPAEPDDPNPVPVFCPEPATAFGGEHYPTLDPKKVAKGKVIPADFLFDCPRWHLCLDTETIHREKWPTVPGAKWVNYTRPLEVRAVRAKPIPSDLQKPNVAKFLVDGAVLPLVAETLPLAEQLRRALLSKCKYFALRAEPALADADVWRRSPAFWGKDAQGQPQTGHEHAFFLPTDDDGDGRVDHLTVFARIGFNELERRAIAALRCLTFGNGEPLRLELIALGGDRDFRTPLLGESRVWVSAAPFIITRHPKRRGRKRDAPELIASPPAFIQAVLMDEIERLRDRCPSLPDVEMVEPCIDQNGAFWIKPETWCKGGGAPILRPLQFRRFRQKRGDDGGRRLSGAFKITFAEPVRGPICLGHSSHFGMGLFLPAAEDQKEQ